MTEKKAKAVATEQAKVDDELKKNPPKGRPKAVELPGLAETFEHVIVDIELVQIEHGPFQIRDLDNVSADLAASMKLDGLLQPITVREKLPQPRGKNVPGTYEIIAGHRRFEAAKSLGWKTIRCQVATKLDDEGAYRLSVTENLRRVDLTPVQEAKTFKLAIDRLKWTEAHLMKATGRSAVYISQRLAILELDEQLQAQIAANLSPSKAFFLAPLGQFDRVKGVAAPLQDFDFVKAHHDWTVDQVRGWVSEYFDRHSFPIEGWDSEICKARGCLGAFGDHKALCLDARHTFEMIVASRQDAILKDIADFLADPKTAKMGITEDIYLPIYYDLDPLRPSRDVTVYSDFDEEEGPDDPKDDDHQPRGYPRCPFKVETYSYSGTDRGAFTWKLLMEHVTGAAREKCISCPGWKKGAEQGRALYWSRGDYYNANKNQVRALCMSAPCRVKQIEKSKKDPAKKGKERLRTKQMSALQPQLQQAVEDLYKRLLKDRPRILAMSMVSRYKLTEVPFIAHKLKESAQRRGIKIPADDGTANGLVKALASLGERELLAIWADHAVYYLDNIKVDTWVGYGKQSPSNLQPKRVEATAQALFGEPTALEIKTKVRETEKAVREDHNSGKGKKASAPKAKARAQTPKQQTAASRKTATKEAAPAK